MRIVVDQDFRSGLGHVTPIGVLDAEGTILLRDEVLKCAAEHPGTVLVDLDQIVLAGDLHLTVLLTLARGIGGGGVALLVHVHQDSSTGLAARRILSAGLPVYPTRDAAEAAALVAPASPGRMHLHLQPDPAAPAAARALVGQACEAWGVPGVRADAQVIVSELVSNVVRHAHTDLDVTVVRRHRHLIVQVRDHSPEPPRVRAPAAADGLSGRGLRLVADLAADWGMSTGAYGKTIWASLRLDPNPAAPPA